MSIDIPEFEKSRVLVFGDVMLDRYWHGATSSISPEAPVPVVRGGEAGDRPGGACGHAGQHQVNGTDPPTIGHEEHPQSQPHGHQQSWEQLRRVPAIDERPHP